MKNKIKNILDWFIVLFSRELWTRWVMNYVMLVAQRKLNRELNKIVDLGALKNVDLSSEHMEEIKKFTEELKLEKNIDTMRKKFSKY